MNEALRKIEILWSKELKHAVHRGEKTFFQFRCILNNGISPDRFDDIDLQLPTEFKEFLLVSNGADLFKDEEYGQWGARIFSIDELQSSNKYYRELRGEFKHEVRQFQKPYDNQQAEQISLMV